MLVSCFIEIGCYLSVIKLPNSATKIGNELFLIYVLLFYCMLASKLLKQCKLLSFAT